MHNTEDKPGVIVEVIVEPVDIRLVTGKDDPYSWKYLPEKEHLFKKQIRALPGDGGVIRGCSTHTFVRWQLPEAGKRCHREKSEYSEYKRPVHRLILRQARDDAMITFSAVIATLKAEKQGLSDALENLKRKIENLAN